MQTWPFHDSPNTAVFTVCQIIDGEPVLLVNHDSDGYWEFLTGNTFDMSEARLVGLSEIVSLDARLIELFNLPLMWKAWRDSSNEPWQRMPMAQQEP